MPNISRRRVNPYLFLLLKRMLEYDIVGIGPRPTWMQVSCFIYARHRGSFFKETVYTDKKGKRDERAYSLATTFRRELFGQEDFEFSVERLNLLANEIVVLGKFESWQQFAEVYKDDVGATVAEVHFMDRPFTELFADQQQSLYAWVEAKVLDMHFDYIRTDKTQHSLIIRNTSRFTIRSVARREIEELVRFGLSQRDYMDLLNDQNSFTFIYKDNYAIQGFLTLKSQSAVNFQKTETSSGPSNRNGGNVQQIVLQHCHHSNWRIMYLLLQDLHVMLQHITTKNVELVGTVAHAIAMRAISDLHGIKNEAEDDIEYDGHGYYGQFRLDWLNKTMQETPTKYFQSSKTTSNFLENE